MIKYEENIDCVIGRKLYCRDFNIKGKTLKEVISKISKSRKYIKYKNKINSICIDIEGIARKNDFIFLDDVVINDNLNVDDSKRIISSIAITRHLYVSPDLSEIYSEIICARNKDSSTMVGVFDYSLMYGNYEEYVDGNSVKIPLWEGYRNSNNGTIFRIKGIIHHPNAIITRDMFSNGVYCMYEGTIYDDNGSMSGWVEESDIPIPVSLFKPIK